MSEILLTIGITSYNRINELKRALESIYTSHPDKIEIVVSEDKSPLREQIRKMVDEFAQNSQIKVVFNSNEHNLGYDRNLKKIITLSSGKFVFFLSDDDCLFPDSIDKLFEPLSVYSEIGVLYSPFFQCGNNEYRRYYRQSYIFTSGENYAASHITDSILFSGLVFRKDVVEVLDAEPFLNKNYFQVYMFLYASYKCGGYYLGTPTVRCVDDGENAYGTTDSSEKNALLANRKSPLSALEFNKGLFDVIRLFDIQFSTSCFKAFEKEFNLRSFVGMSIARKYGRSMLVQYWGKMKSMDIKIRFISRIYYIILWLFGENLCSLIMFLPKRSLLFVREEIQ